MNRLHEFGEKMRSFPQQLDKYYQVYSIVVGLPIMAGAFTQLIFLFLFRLSPWVSIIAVILAFVLLVWSYKLVYGMLQKYKDIQEINLRREIDFLILGYFGTVAVLAVIALSTLSYLLFHFHIVQYNDLSNKRLDSDTSFETFTGFYWWYLIDNLPGVDTNSFNWQRSLTPANFLSKLFVLIFQLFIAYAFLVAIKQWWDNRRHSDVERKSILTDGSERS